MRGSISKRGAGWQVVVDQGSDPLSGKRRRKAKTFPTRAEAEDALPQMLQAARAKTPAPKSLTVGELLDRWLAHVEQDLSPNTLRGYRTKVRVHLMPALRDLLREDAEVLRDLGLTHRLPVLQGLHRLDERHGHSVRSPSAVDNLT